MTEVQVGCRVIRGPDWEFQNQDGGDGHAGTLIAINGDGYVTVQWDSGMQRKYRAGHDGKFDLLLFDNAQTGVVHDGIGCEKCKEQPICGIRWTCVDCFNIHLCMSCYMSNQHSTIHDFKRYDTPTSRAEAVGSRKYAEQKSIKGIFPGAQVKRGINWKFGNVDGGEDGIGEVTSTVTWNPNGYRGAVKVQWQKTNKETLCRLVDVVIEYPANLGDYYHAHLPIVGLDIVTIDDLITAAEAGDEQQVNFIVRRYPQLVNRKNGSSETPLYVATFRGHIGVVRALIEGGASVNDTGNDKWETALHAAVHQEHLGVHQLLLQNGADVNQADNDGDTPLHFAAYRQIPEIMEVLLRVDGVAINAKNRKGQTSLHVAAGKENIECSQLLIEAGASPSIKDNENDSVLHDILKMFPSNETLLDLVFRSPHADFSIFNGTGLNVMHLAATTNNQRAVELIVECSHDSDRDDVNFKPHLVNGKTETDGFTPLHICAVNGHVEIADILLEAGADIENVDNNNQTPLIHAVSRTQKEMVAFFLGKGCQVNHTNTDGNTALHILLDKADILMDRGPEKDMLEMLLKKQAKIDLKNRDGKTPLDLCNNEDVRCYILRTHVDATTSHLLPSFWGKFPDQAIAHTVSLNSQQQEYKDVEQRFSETLGDKKIISIERVQSKFLWEHYRLLKLKMDRERTAAHMNEMRLFHCTNEDLNWIIQHNIETRNVSKQDGFKELGRGAYFKRDARDADDLAVVQTGSCRLMLQCLVICGRWTQGIPEYTRPPLIDQNNPRLGIYDCCVDNIDQPKTFCLFDKSQYYPEFIIRYR